MDKLRLGTIGTSWITDSFIQAALATDLYELNCVYSRTVSSGSEFSSEYGEIPVETNLEKFIIRDDLDVIYIASPNSLHYEQTLLALKAKKHVMVEKPASINAQQWDKMVKVAKENDVFVLEAAKHMFVPNLNEIIKETQELGDIRGATLPYAKYSSRYDNVLAGEEPNIFSLDFAGGALMDLGIYPVYTSVALFGKPEETFYFPRKISTGVDGIGTIILRYDTFDVTILVGKIVSSNYEVEIYGEDETLIIDHVSGLNHARLLDVRTNEEKEIELFDQHENDMYYEAETLAKMIMNKNHAETKERYRKLSEMSRIVSDILHDLRKQADIRFTFEEKE